MKTTEYSVKMTDYLPRKGEIQEGIIYVSTKFEATTHLCPCGCGFEMYLPYNGHEKSWDLIWHEAEKVLSLDPSIELTGGCRSHYYIKQNKITL